MNAPAKIGYDGEPPQFREARDLHGKGKRETVLGPQNIAVDRLEWMLAHKRIEQYQHQAGRQLQADVQLAEIATYATSGARTGGSGSSTLSDAKCDAISRVNGVRVSLRGLAWRILELVVIDGLSVEKAETRLRLRYRAGHGALLVALDSLAAHYNLA